MAESFNNDYVKAEFARIFDPTRDPADQNRECVWFRNILYYLGEQWLLWFRERSTFGRAYEFNLDIPTPVTNIIRDYVRSMKALTLNKRFRTAVWPNSKEQSDKDAAELAKQLLASMDASPLNATDDIKELTELWRVLVGSGFVRTYPDKDTGKYIRDRNGKVVTPRGDVALKSIIPFNVVVPHLGTTLPEKRYTGIKTLVEKEWVEDTYGVKVQTTDASDQQVDYLKQLLTLVSNVSPWRGQTGGAGSDEISLANEDLVVLQEVEYKPTKKYPEGRYAVMAGGAVLKRDTHLPIPVDRSTGDWHYTLTHFTFDYTPGGFWPTGGVDDLISPQNTINTVDQAMALNRETLGQPMLMSPVELVIKRLTHRSSKLLMLQYDARHSMGAKPEIVSGKPYPQQILEERRLHREGAQDAAGDPKNILRGQSPHSGASGVMVDILREAAEQGHAPDVNRFYRAWAQVDRKRLVIAQDLYTEKRLLKAPGKGNEVIVRNFKGSDLRNNTDVHLEPTSGVSTTAAGRNNFILQLVQAGFWGDLTQRPTVQAELLDRFDMGGFPDEDDVHVDRAEWENAVISTGKEDELALIMTPPPVDGAESPIPQGDDPLFMLDRHDTHVAIHDKLILSREFRDLHPLRQALAIAHRMLHEQTKAQEEMEALQAVQNLTGEGAVGDQGQGGATPPMGNLPQLQ